MWGGEGWVSIWKARGGGKGGRFFERLGKVISFVISKRGSGGMKVRDSDPGWGQEKKGRKERRGAMA